MADTDDPIGPAGVPFPREHEWLDLPAPPAAELPVAGDFVERTLRAVTAARAEGEAPGAEDELARPLLGDTLRQAFAAPAPSPTFVEQTMQALRRDRSQRWRELLTRHIAPEPSPQFVARTLAALAADRGAARRTGLPRGEAGGSGPGSLGRLHRLRAAAWPLLAAAAVLVGWLALRDRSAPPLELRLAQREPIAFAHAHAASPMAALLDARDRALDPTALPAGGPDATWLLLEADR